MTSPTSSGVFFQNSSTFLLNATEITTAVPPWKDKDLGQLIIEIVYLTILAAFGTVGNLTVIFSIMLEKRVHSHGNIFVINLALADLMITGFVVPTVIANAYVGGNALPYIACQMVGYVVTVTCTCSLCNLTFIAINRYWAVVYSKTYINYFTKGRVYWMVFGIWVWSNLLTLPTVLGWSRIEYDVKIQLCSWDDTYKRTYTVFLSLLAVLIPLCIIFFCYTKLFLAVRSSGRWVRSLSTVSGVNQNSEQHKRSMRKERNLLKTLMLTVAFFIICWLPYVFTIIIDPVGIPPTPKKIFGWMGLSNSAVNFGIYGIVNPVFRRGYRNLFVLIFRCQRARRRYGSNVVRGSHSDSFYRSTVKGKKKTPNTPQSRNSIKSNGNVLNQPRSSFSYQNSIQSTGWRTPQMHTKLAQNEVNGNASSTPLPIIISQQDKLEPVANTVSSFKKPSGVLRWKKTNEKERNLMDREGRMKRNSLMLLQIEMNDDDDDDNSFMDYRRTKSEIPSGVKKPGKIRRNSDYLKKADYSYSEVAQVTKDKADNQSAGKCDSSEDVKPDFENNADRNKQETNSDCESVSLSNAPTSLEKLGSIHESTEMLEPLSVELIQQPAHLSHHSRQNETIEIKVIEISPEN